MDMAVKLGVRSASLSGSGTENASHASQHKDASGWRVLGVICSFQGLATLKRLFGSEPALAREADTRLTVGTEMLRIIAFAD